MISAIVKVESTNYPVSYYNYSDRELLSQQNLNQTDFDIILDYKNNTEIVLYHVMQQQGYITANHLIEPNDKKYGYFFSVWETIEDFQNLLNASNIGLVQSYRISRNNFLQHFGFFVSKVGIFDGMPTDFNELQNSIALNNFSIYPNYSPFLDN